MRLRQTHLTNLPGGNQQRPQRSSVLLQLVLLEPRDDTPQPLNLDSHLLPRRSELTRKATLKPRKPQQLNHYAFNSNS